jgi:hypothetical protein
MPTTITSAGITFNDATSLTSAVIPANAVGATQIVNGSVTAVKLGTTEQKQICKAWVNFNGTTSPGTIRSSYNVSSVTKTNTGRYIVNFTTAMTDVNYTAVMGTSCRIGSVNGIILVEDTVNSTRTTSALPITSLSLGSAYEDTSISQVAIFGN